MYENLVVNNRKLNLESSCRRICPWMDGSRVMQEQLPMPVSIENGTNIQENSYFFNGFRLRSCRNDGFIKEPDFYAKPFNLFLFKIVSFK